MGEMQIKARFGREPTKESFRPSVKCERVSSSRRVAKAITLGPGRVGRIQRGTVVFALTLLSSLPANGAGRQRAFLNSEFSQPTPIQTGTAQVRPAKRVLDLKKVPSVVLELPDSESMEFGPAFELSIINALHETGRYRMLSHVERESFGLRSAPEAGAEKNADPGWFWFSSNTPAASIEIAVKEVSFRSGSRGDRMFYGFSENFSTPYNSPESGAPVGPFDIVPVSESSSNASPVAQNENSASVDSIANQRGRKNEFPVAKHSWFGNAFDKKGKVPWDSTSGLELGEGFSIFYGYGNIALKYAKYSARVVLKVRVRAPLARDFVEERTVVTDGTGVYFDIAASYLGYKASLGVARKTAMQDAIKKALAATLPAIERSVSNLPLVARVDHVAENGLLLLGNGTGTNVPIGTEYVIVNEHGVRICEGKVRVRHSVVSGAIGEWIIERSQSPGTGGPCLDPTTVGMQSPAEAPTAAEVRFVPKLGVLLRQYAPRWDDNFRSEINSLAVEGPHADDPAALSPKAQSEGQSLAPDPSRLGVESPAPDEIHEAISVPPLDLNVTQSEETLGAEKAEDPNGFLALISLPYRIWRYFQYDQDRPKNAAHAFSSPAAKRKQSQALDWVRGASGFPSSLKQPDRAENEQRSEWQTSGTAPESPWVAVLDSGVDYVHPAIAPSVAEVSLAAAIKMSPKERVGWDFISMDPRAYDDHYHGTQVASLVLAAAPQVRILPVKIFNPYGDTSSAAIYAGFKYALQRGARIIVCAWGTAVDSRVLRDAVAMAESQGVWVVTALSRREANEFPALLAGGMSPSGGQRYGVLSIDGDDRRLRVAEPRGERGEAAHFSMAAGLFAGALGRVLSRHPALAPNEVDYPRMVKELANLGIVEKRPGHFAFRP